MKAQHEKEHKELLRMVSELHQRCRKIEERQGDWSDCGDISVYTALKHLMLKACECESDIEHFKTIAVVMVFNQRWTWQIPGIIFFNETIYTIDAVYFKSEQEQTMGEMYTKPFNDKNAYKNLEIRYAKKGSKEKIKRKISDFYDEKITPLEIKHNCNQPEETKINKTNEEK